MKERRGATRYSGSVGEKRGEGNDRDFIQLERKRREGHAQGVVPKKEKGKNLYRPGKGRAAFLIQERAAGRAR